MGYEIGKLTRLNLGNQGESNSRPIEIDVTDWLKTWPDATLGLLVKRPGEETFAPVTISVQNGLLKWTPTRADTEIAGEGKAQFVLTDENDVELRSRVVNIIIAESMPGSVGEAPGPLESFVADVLAAARTAEEAVDKMPKIVNGRWHVWNADLGDYIDTLVEAQGPKGNKGASITNVYQSQLSIADGGLNKLAIEVDGKLAAEFGVYNGKTGAQGPQGEKGAPGPG